MTGSIALETIYTSKTNTGSDGIPPLSYDGLAELVEIANDDCGEETISCSSAQPQAGKAPRHGTTDGRRRWQLLCSEPVSVNEDAVSDEDLLAVLLSYLNSSNPRDLATQLLTRFETFGSVVSARETQIIDAAPGGAEIIDFFKVIRAAGTRMAREEISNRPLLDEWEKLVTYLRTAMAHETVEQFRVLFLDRRNVLIADEVQHRGTIDHTPLYPREVVRRALELDASAIIMVHNHPSNHPAPSKPDITMTRTVRDALERLGIVLHDHIIVSRRGHTSFRRMGLLDAQCA
ncbi:MAG: DNA repair protein RadC [Rhodospirillales bacterium]